MLSITERKDSLGKVLVNKVESRVHAILVKGRS